MDLVAKAMHCNSKHAFNLKLDPALLDIRDLILLLNLTSSRVLVFAVEIRSFPLKYFTYRVIYRTEYFECW